jgi:uncharacterized repeat protein (TIGR01451 family)
MQGNAKSFLKAVLLGFGLALLVLGTALAMTPAGTQIQNQASASYTDSAGQSRIATSNQVTTVVQQVYSFTIIPNGTESAPGQTKVARPGAEVFFSYLVTNTGNGTDTINLSPVQGFSDNFNLGGPTIFLDANCNGNLDSGETTLISSVTLDMGQQACVIMRGTIPSGATTGQYGNLNLVGTSAGSPSVTDNDNWARAVASGGAVLTASKSASPTGPVTPGSTITYTISGRNSSGSAARGVSVTGIGTGILISDTIPNGLVVNTMPTGSADTGTVQIVYSTDGTTWAPLTSADLPLTGNGTIAVGMVISGSGSFFFVGATYTFSFQATVPSSAPVGTGYTNSATVRYHDGTAERTVTTNTTPNTVVAGYQPAVGYPGNVTLGNETQDIASALAGSAVTFTNVVRNDGNLSDSFNLTLENSTFPIGTTCQILADDGTTPISGPIGPFAPGDTQTVLVKCQLPAGYWENPPDGMTSTYKVELKATSVNDSSKSDITTNRLVDIIPQVTLAPNRSGIVSSPGAIQYTHTLTNNNPDTSATCNIGGDGGSHGWTYQYSLDGSTWSASLSGVSVGPGGSQTIYVRVLVPAGVSIGTTDVNTVTANCTLGTVTATATATETTTVEMSGELRLTKSAKTYEGTSTTVRDATGATAYPGDVIEYTIVAENVGGIGNLTDVKISSRIPTYTTFVSVSVTITGFPTGSNILYSTNGTTWSSSAPTSVPTSGTVYVGVDTNGDGNITDADTMPPGARITITLRVRVQ